MVRELVQDHVGRVAARRAGVGRNRYDARTIGEPDFSHAQECFGELAVLGVSFNGHPEGFSPFLALLHPLQGLSFAGGRGKPTWSQDR